MAKQNRKNFMLQGAVLAVSSILVRIIGIIYRVPLNNILGEKGVAYYSIAFDVYSLLLLLSSYSLPLAVSKMVSARMAVKQYRNTKRVFLFALGFSLLLGITAFCIVFFGADVFARLESYPQAAIAIRVLAPNLIVLSVLGVMRGFFQGMGNMVPTAFSNIIEQIINAAVSIIAASALFNSAATVAAGTYEFSNVAEALGAAGGTVGTVAGAVAALAFLIFLFVLYKPTQDRLIRKDTSRYAEPAGAILKTLVLTIIPVILSTTIYNINSLLDIAVFGNIMNTKDIARDAVDVMTGMFSGNYRLIVNVPIALANALSASLIPSIVKSVAQKSRRMVVVKVEAAIKVTMLVAFPCAVGIGVLAKPIVNFLFPTSIDPDKVALMLMIGCVTVVLYSLSTITNSILQGLDRMRKPVLHSALALVTNLALLAILLLIFNIDIFAVVVADLVFALIVCILNMKSIRNTLKYKQEIKNTFIMPLICSVIMGVAVVLVNLLLSSFIGSAAIRVLLCVIVAIVVYAVSILLLKVVDEEELSNLPMGGRIAGICRKLRLLK